MIDKFLEWLDRAKSRIYAIFTFWLAIIFSPILTTLLFADEELIYKKTGLLKNEYISQTYLNLGSIFGWTYLLIGVLAAALMTWLAIWKFPKWFVNKSHAREADNQIQRDIYQLKKEQELEKQKKTLADEQIETAKALVEVVEQKEELESREDGVWSRDYSRFKRSRYFQLFSDVKQCLYRYGGSTYVSDEYERLIFELSSDIAAYLDANNLADVKSGILNLTDKGKYYMKRYLEDDSLPVASSRTVQEANG